MANETEIDIFVHTHYNPPCMVKGIYIPAEGANEYSRSNTPVELGYEEVETYKLEEFADKFPLAAGLAYVLLTNSSGKFEECIY